MGVEVGQQFDMLSYAENISPFFGVYYTVYT